LPSIEQKFSALSDRRRMKRLKKSFFKHGLILANFALVIAVTGFIWSSNNHTSSASFSNSNLSNLGQDSQVAAPLDAVSSADIASNIAKVTSMPEAIAVSNQADSFNAQVASAVTDQAVVTKPQVVTGGTKSNKDIQKYVVKDGDTVASIATQFGVTTDSVKWSNSLTGDSVPVGRELLLPPRNGIVYKVAAGDTAESLAAKYSADKDTLTAFNDAEVGGLVVGQNIVIPDGKVPAPAAVAATTASRISGSRSSADSSVVYGFTPLYGGNGYSPGYCTWYAASRVSIPRNWGNANTWDNNAAASGWTVSSRPVAGAIAQTDAGGWGHVAIVEQVSPDGSQIIYSDMNGIAGFGRVGVSGWVPTSHFPHYIYR
jgi:surface antigen